MKHKYAVLFLLFALSIILLCACREQTGHKETESIESVQDTESDSTGTEPVTSPAVQKDIVIGEMYSEEGSSVIPDGPEFRYGYYVPQIEDNTPDAKSINDEIAAIYGELAKDSMACIRNSEIPVCGFITYESFRSGNLLCLVLKCTYFNGTFEEYGTYSYDTVKGLRLTNEDILQIIGISQEQYLYAVRCAAAKCYDDAYFSFQGEWDTDIVPGDYQLLRCRTLSEKNVTLDLPLYLDQDGVFHTIAAIGCHTGTDWRYQILTPDPETDTAETETDASLGYLAVTRQGRTVKLRFNETEGSSGIPETDGYTFHIPYNTEFSVNGLYDDYVRIFCAAVGASEQPYVFLLTKEGRVDYLDVMMCLQYGYFCAGGPLLGVENVTDFVVDADEDGLLCAYAITGDGERISLQELIIRNQRSMEGCFSGEWNYTITADEDIDAESVWLEVDEEGNFDLTCYRAEQNERMTFHGFLTYLGMTEDGAVYAYNLWGLGSNGPGLWGTVALDMEVYYGDGVSDKLYVRELGGTPLLGVQTGDTTVLEQSFG
ncbi:MAG: hypothetical protein ACI3XM_00125 [Eubacteriales bacterium]